MSIYALERCVLQKIVPSQEEQPWWVWGGMQPLQAAADKLKPANRMLEGGGEGGGLMLHQHGEQSRSGCSGAASGGGSKTIDGPITRQRAGPSLPL